MALIRKEQVYKLNYNFGNSFDNVRVFDYLNELLSGSNVFFDGQVRAKQIVNVQHEYGQMISFIKNVEEYLYYYKDSPNFENIFKSISNVKRISVLPSDSRGIYGQAIAETNTLLINPDLLRSSTLTASERTRLYVAHELGHIVNNDWVKMAKDYANQQAQRGVISQKQSKLFESGFDMLDEAITQNRAENFAYSFAGKNRPGMRSTTRGVGVYANVPYLTNFDFYGEFQIPASRFAKTLRGIGKYDNNQTALDMLSTRALSPNFANDIINEYVRDGQFANLVTLAEKMGIIKNAVYTSFGVGRDYDALRNSGGALLSFLNLADRMRDRRDPVTPTRVNSQSLGQPGGIPQRVIHENANMENGISLSRIESLINPQNERKPGFLARIIKSVKDRIANRGDRDQNR